MGDDAWCLPIGESLDEPRARLFLARFGPEAKRLGQERVARLRASNPVLQVEARVFGVDTLLSNSTSHVLPSQPSFATRVATGIGGIPMARLVG